MALGKQERTAAIRRTLVRSGTAIVASALVACSMLAGIDEYHVGLCKGGVCGRDARPDEDDGDEDPVDSGPRPVPDSGVVCTGKQAPASVRVGSPGNTFCIDSTEVTNGQYAAFLEAGVPASQQPPECVWNTSFAPLRSADAAAPAPEVPVTNVDWCDARAFCEWSGKYLCGRVEQGKKTGPVTADGLSDYKTHQWMLACSAEARLRYPYGATYDPRKCNLNEYEAGAPLPAGAAAGCTGGYDGLHDLLGNVWEWYDGPCRSDGGLERPDAGDGGPASDSCMLKGGGYANPGEALDCRYDFPAFRRDGKQSNVGFRCCSD